MVSVLMVIVFFFVLFMMLSLSSSHTEDSYTGETGNTTLSVYDDYAYDDTENEDEDETEEESSLSEKIESAWIIYEMMKAADEEFRINHAQCGKCRNCRYSHDEEHDGFLTTNRHEIYACSWTGEEITDNDLFDERVCGYFEMK